MGENNDGRKLLIFFFPLCEHKWGKMAANQYQILFSPYIMSKKWVLAVAKWIKWWVWVGQNGKTKLYFRHWFSYPYDVVSYGMAITQNQLTAPYATWLHYKVGRSEYINIPSLASLWLDVPGIITCLLKVNGWVALQRQECYVSHWSCEWQLLHIFANTVQYMIIYNSMALFLL